MTDWIRVLHVLIFDMHMYPGISVFCCCFYFNYYYFFFFSFSGILESLIFEFFILFSSILEDLRPLLCFT